jgi:predicted aspartyl protease
LKFLKTVYAFLCILACVHSTSAATGNPKLRELYDARQYFDLRDALGSYRADRAPELHFYLGVVSNKFNRPRVSIYHLSRYLKQSSGKASETLLIEGYEILADNYLKTYQYAKAAEAYRILLTKFRHIVTTKKKSDYENALRLWGALSKVPPQATTFAGSSVVQQEKDGRFPLAINGQKVSFAFDSGANLSVITDSMARQLSLDIIDASIEVGAIAGNKVTAKLAVAPKTELGNVVIRNAVFLVFDDKDLYVAEADFQINGLVGFPIIESLRQITFARSGGIIVPANPRQAGEQNMCLDGFSPLIAGWFNGQRLTFALDTGATTSTLYPPFFNKFENQIRSRFPTHMEKLTGVGGYREIKSYLGKDVALQFSGREARFGKIPILTVYTTENSRYFFGNLGQDLVKQFEKMTLNFEAMSVVFE